MNPFLRSIAIVTFAALAAPGVAAGTFKHIAIDGDFTDWAGVPVAYSDASEEGAAAGTDFKDVWIAHDQDHVFVRVSFYNTGDLLRSQNNVFVNADGDIGTGYATGGGSEMVIQGGTGYQERNGTFNDGFGIQDLDWASAPAGVDGQFEFRFSRRAKFEDGGDVFAGTLIGILLETENNDYDPVDTAGDDASIEYTLDDPPPAGTGTLSPITLDNPGTTWRFNRAGTALPDEWRDPGYDDAGEGGWEDGQALFGRTPNPGAYPTAIRTPFTDDYVTHYFRAKFNWASDPAGLDLLFLPVLSDGALVYLNGAPVTRIRLPAGAVGFDTTATGPAPNPGAVETFDLPPGALVIGENVLAVEVHQSAGDTTELIFGASLTASYELPVVIVEPAAPQTLEVDEGSAAVFTVTVRGAAPITFQWFKGATPIDGATNDTYTIPAVTPGDAGEYLVRASNAGAQNVASPPITLVPRAVPITITDPALPADTAVIEGNLASFTVAVAGSQPISFQWLKDSSPIPDATNQIHSIPFALPADAGLYACVISNRVTAPLTSRAARLTVNPDGTAPLLAGATAGGTRIRLQFSEPIRADSLQPQDFSLNPAVNITGAAPDPDDASGVLLTTAPLAYGTLYTVTVTGVTDLFENPVAPGTQREVRALILVDGDFSDWAGIPMALSDPEDAGPETGAHADYGDVWVTSDDDYVYLYFTLWRPDDPFIFYNNIFVDADNEPATGLAFGGLGSDMLIQGGGGYEQQPGEFNDGTVDDLDWLAAPEPPGTAFEARFSRHARYTDTGERVFNTDTIALVLESENNAFATQDTAPDAGGGGLVHVLLNFGPGGGGPVLVVTRAGNLVRITWDGPGDLQATDSFAPANWQTVAGAASPYEVAPDDQQRFYRLIVE